MSRPLDLLSTLTARLQDALGGGQAGGAASQARNRAEKATSQARDAYGDVLGYVERVASSRPLILVATSVGAGVVLGVLAARRR